MRDREQGNRGRLRRRTGRRLAVLVVQVEAEHRLHAIAQRLQGAALGRLQVQRVAIDVDALRVAPGVALGAVRVEHRHQVQRQAILETLHHGGPALAPDPFEQVEDRRSRRRLVAVHLRPEQHVRRPAADRQMQQVAAFDGAADDLARHPARVGVHGARHRRDHVVVGHERGRRQRDVVGVPPRGERNRAERRRGVCRARARRRGRRRRRGGRMPGRAPGQGGHAGDQRDTKDRRFHDDGCPYFSRTIEARWPGCGASTNTLS